MPEQLTKFEPHRNVHLRGFSGFGACASIHDATATGFTVSGVFRQPDDFAVVTLYDADDFFGHPTFRYLPDFALDGVKLQFNMAYSAGLQPIDSVFYPWIDWAYLDLSLANGSTAQVKLSSVATLAAGIHSQAQASITISTSGTVYPGDIISIFYLNQSWQYQTVGFETATQIALALTNQINATYWPGVNASITFTATSSGATITLVATQPGSDANSVTLYTVANSTAVTGTPTAQFSGGNSLVTWTITLDFSALGYTQIRSMWLTLAPALQRQPYATTTWDAVFSNWSVTADPFSRTPLYVAAPGSVRVESTDAWCSYSGAWSSVTGPGFFSQGSAQLANVVGASVTVKYACGQTHNLYLGTALFTDRAKVNISIDGGGLIPLDCYLAELSPVVTRRLIVANFAAGLHTVTITIAGQNPLSTGANFFFDYLEAAAPGPVPDPAVTMADLSPAIDYDTDHGYRLSPARLCWMFDKLGFTGPFNEYAGVFWWPQRVAVGLSLASSQIIFSGTWPVGSSVTLNLSGGVYNKTVVAGDTVSTIAAHFEYWINATSSALWASATGGYLTLTTRAASAQYQLVLAVSVGALHGTYSVTGSLSGSTAASWNVDPTQSPVINYPAQLWHVDLFNEVHSRGNTIVSALSMEVVNPPDAPPSHVWAQRFLDGSAVLTDTGYNNLKSTQCAPMATDFLNWQKAAFYYLAQLQNAAGLVPSLQLGEFLWWFFSNYNASTNPAGGMAFYDAATTTAANIYLGRALQHFIQPTDDPTVNASADANFLAQRLLNHMNGVVGYVQATFSNAVFELLWPYDVNYPTPYGLYALGGRLNHAVNLPAALLTSSGAPVQRLKLEGLDFGSGSRTLDKVKELLALFQSGWTTPANLRYLFPLFNAGCPWQHELALARAAGYTAITPFAMDHVCLFAWQLDKTLSPTFATESQA